MPWDGSGNFTRSHDWTDDAAAALNIEASRMDTEDDNFSTGIGACLTKNNESKPTAHFQPNAASTYDLGQASKRWRDLYLSRNADIDGEVDAATGVKYGGVSLIVPVARVVGASGATVDISLNYGFKNYRLEIHDVLPATDAAALYLRVSTDTGSTFDAGASDYDNNGINGAQIQLAGDVGNVSTEGAAISLMIPNASSTARHQRIWGNGVCLTAAGVAATLAPYGKRSAAQNTDYLRLLFSSGNISNCDYTVFGWN